MQNVSVDTINSTHLDLSPIPGCASEWGCVNESKVHSELVVRIPIPVYFDGVRPCLFRRLLPDEDGECHDPGYYGELGLSLARMHYPHARVQHIPVQSLSHSDAADANTSLAMILNQTADIISYATSVDPERLSALSYTQLMRGPSLTFVMKNFNSHPPNLSVADLIMTPAGYWFLLLTLVAIKFFAKELLVRQRLLVWAVLGWAGAELRGVWLPKTYSYVNLVLSLSLGLFMAGLANYFFVVFSRKRSLYAFADSEQALLEGLLSGELRALTFSYTLFHLLLKPGVESKFTAGFLEAARRNPPLLLNGSYDAADELLQRDDFDSAPKHVWIIWDHEEPMLLSKYCGLHFSKDVKDHNWVFDTFYRAHNFSFPMSLVDIVLYKETRRRLQRKYFARRSNCTFPWVDPSSLTLGMRQVAGVFVFFLMCCGASVVALVAEALASCGGFVAAVRRTAAASQRRLGHLCRCFVVHREFSPPPLPPDELARRPPKDFPRTPLVYGYSEDVHSFKEPPSTPTYAASANSDDGSDQISRL